MDLFYDGNGILAGYTQRDSYTDWAGAQYTNVYSREMTRDGDRILTEKVTSIDGALLTNDVKNVKYMYDAKGASGMIVDGTKYYFRKNIFGDVVEIYNESGAKCAEYAYDAWGTCYTTLDTNGVGSLNPFRYRGYYFVSRIGLYYLTTRFYDYTTGRFINVDVPSICFDDGLTLPEGCNLYSYCRNNPISYVDPTGHFAIVALILGAFTLAGGIAGGIIAYQNAASDGKKGSDLIWSVISGIILGAGIGLAAGGAFVFLGGMFASLGAAGLNSIVFGITAQKAFAWGVLAWNITAWGIMPIYGVTMQGIDYEPSSVVVPKPQETPPHPGSKTSILTDRFRKKILKF